MASAAVQAQVRTSPDQTRTDFPPGVPYIIGNEAAERFSFYGARSILAIFMTSYLMSATGQSDTMSDNEAGIWFHNFVSAVYFCPLLGGLLSDGVLGKYRTILYLSIVYCFGHLALAINDTRLGLAIGLGLIAIGAGGIKSCVGANVGDQFGVGNKHLIPKVFGWFYLSINFGSTISNFLCPILLSDPHFGSHYAFGLPGVLMLIATIVFWLGRKKFVHVPAGGLGFLREAVSPEGRRAIANLLLIYVFIAIFWALWDQSAGGEWTIQAKYMDLRVLGIEINPGQVQILNPILILIYVPLLNFFVFPFFDRFYPLTPLRRICIGLFLTAGSFAVIWLIQLQIDQGAHPHAWQQVPAYLLLTLGELFVSLCGLEFSYTQAPPRMKSVVIALFYLSVTAGNLLTAQVHVLIPALKKMGINLDGANFFLFFTLLMLGFSIVFVFVSRLYRGKTYIQGDDSGAGLADDPIA